MEVLKVGRTQQTRVGGGRHRTWARFKIGGLVRKVYFETDDTVPFLQDNLGDIWVAPALVMAMRNGLDLRLRDPISNGRREELDAVQDVFTTWYPDRMTKVAIKAPRGVPLGRPRPRDERRVIATCFTGGVDSFDTLVRNRERIGGLIYGFGLDGPVDREDFRTQVRGLLDQVSAETGIPLLTATTNIRKVLRAADTRWGYEGHGAALAALGTVFASSVRRLLVPSTHTYLNPPPWGSSPLLDERWSTKRLRVTYEGGHSSRVRKTQQIAHSSLAQRHLRVCYSQHETLNCGRCAKCLRTMATLRVFGTLDRFTTFHEPLDLDHLARFEIEGERNVERMRDVCDLAQEAGEADVAAALKSMLDRYEARSRDDSSPGLDTA